MQKTIGVLSVLLAAQLLLAVATSFTRPDLATVRPDTPLLDLGERVVDKLTIEDAGNNQLVLTRQDDGWVLPAIDGFPADKTKVDLLLDRLKGLKRGLTVATSEGAMRRFKVSDDAFERRVIVAQHDEQLATVYFGTSPGMRRVHARTIADDAVYEVEFGIHDATVKSEDWEDKTVLEVPLGEIEKISLAGLTLKRLPAAGADAASADGDTQTSAQANWAIEALTEGETINQLNADALAEKLSGLQIGSVLGSEAKAEYGLEEPELVVDVERKGGVRIEYELGKRDKDYVLKASSRAEYFRLPGHAGDALIKAARREQLVTAASDAGVEDVLVSEQHEVMAEGGGHESQQGAASDEAIP